MKLLLTNKNYIVIMVLTGGSMGYFNALITQMQQFLCARNYDIWVTGAVSASFMLVGTVGGGLQVGETGLGAGKSLFMIFYIKARNISCPNHVVSFVSSCKCSPSSLARQATLPQLARFSST